MIDEQVEYTKDLMRERDEAVKALRAAMDYINASPCDPDITREQIKAWNQLVDVNPSAILRKYDAEDKR